MADNLIYCPWEDRKIIELIGSGHFSKVYKAVRQDIHTGDESAAIKIINATSFNVDNLVTEIKTLREIKNFPNALYIEDYKVVEEWRAAWAECCNARLAEHERIDHRSYKRQGIDKIPTVHEGYVARKLAAQGQQSDRVQLNEEIRKRNALIQKVVSQLRAIEKEIVKLNDMREFAGLKQDVILSEFEGINKFADIKPKNEKKPLSVYEIRMLAELKHQYVYHYCANEYLKRYGELQYSAQEEYDKARKIINSYSRIITEYCNIKEKIKNTINPIKKISLRKELAEQGDKACDAARGLSSYFNSSLYYNNCELDYNNITYDHLSAIKSYTDHAIFQKKAAAEKEKSYNEIREQLKSRNISDKSVDLAYRKLVTVVAAVPDEQCELALKVVKEPTKYFSFEEYGHNSEHRLAALKNVEKAISRLYEAVKRIKPEIKTEQKQEKKKHRSYGGRSR